MVVVGERGAGVLPCCCADEEEARAFMCGAKGKGLPIRNGIDSDHRVCWLSRARHRRRRLDNEGGACATIWCGGMQSSKLIIFFFLGFSDAILQYYNIVFFTSRLYKVCT